MKLALACAGALVAAAAAVEGTKPNVMLIFVDDLGFGDPGFAGHPTNVSPNIDALRARGKRFSSWYSGCPVCTGSRASIMTGRVYSRVGVPGVFGPTSQTGLPLSETVLSEQFKSRGYATAIFGKWHLGQREPFLPAHRGFDSYLGIPFSDDMGKARLSACQKDDSAARMFFSTPPSSSARGRAAADDDDADGPPRPVESWEMYADAGFTQSAQHEAARGDPAQNRLPLVAQAVDGAGRVRTTVVEQPVDLTTLAEKYAAFGRGAIRGTDGGGDAPFFLYAALSHVHTTAANLPHKQFAGCAFRGTSRRGPFGDALAEADWIVGELVEEVRLKSLDASTVFIFSSDNGPWMVQRESGGSMGHVYGGFAGYWNTGKGSTWEGGVREPAFVTWDGVVEPGTTTLAPVSSLDVFPTLSALIGAPLPSKLKDFNNNKTTTTPGGGGAGKMKMIFDGVDQSAAFFGDADAGSNATRPCLFLFGGPSLAARPSAARCGPYKLHYATGPGIGGGGDTTYYDPPLVFNVESDPSEIWPLDAATVATAVLDLARDELAKFMATYEPGQLTLENGGLVDDRPDEIVNGTAYYGVCCDRQAANTCSCDGDPYHPPLVII